MKLPTTPINNVASYAGDFPKEISDLIEQLRLTIMKAAPGADEVIS